MQGNLRQIQLPEVLQFISMGKSTGKLSIRPQSQGEIVLMIKDGCVINSTALERKRRLGDLLVNRGLLKRSELSEVLALQRSVESDKRLGEILVEREYVKEETITEVLRLQLEEEIWNLFGLEEGEFKFENTNEQEVGPGIVEIGIDPLIIEGTRRQDEWSRIRQFLPDDEIILGVQAGEDLMESAATKKPRFSAREWKVVSQINGIFPIRAIVNRSGMGRFDVYRIISECMERGFLVIKDRETLPIYTNSLPSNDGTQIPASGTQAKRSGGGLFSGFLGGKRDEKIEEPIHFISPIGALTSFVNQLSARLGAQTEDFEPKITFDLWADQLVYFSRADLIVCEKGQLNAQQLEAFIKMAEFSQAGRDAFEDGVEALIQIADVLYRSGTRKLGAKNAQKTTRELADEILTRARFEYGQNYPFSDRLRSALDLE